MRIVIVSAHYPPEFVSGGTLVPQRLARGLAARRHDVSVYAGSLDRNMAPLETRSDQDPSGVAVRWIAAWPWIDWSDRRNYDNPPVAADFAAWLAEVRPDVVHLHSLQSLGCGLIEAASAAGAAVVLTMHDFWWICGRQFLVDRSYRPCCLVVAAGACQCQVDRKWLEGRTERLGRALALVEQVLVPSASAARVLEANGVASGRIEVDTNGLPIVDHHAAVVDPVPAAGAEARLRLVYAGGPDQMKGSAVLAAAVSELAHRGGWRLTAYGLDPATVPAGAPVDVRAPFPEAELSAVLAGADVLLLPSIMRETFSILTREALANGVPVVATDTLGPEEVIVDGRNGLIVPAADPAALARAVNRLLDEPDLLRTLRHNATAVPIRALDDQVAANEDRYRRLVDRRGSELVSSPHRRSDRPIRRVIFAVGIDGAPLRYRARLPAEGLALHGVDSAVLWYRDPDLPDLLAEADAAVFYRVPATIQVLDLIAQARRRNCPVLFDVDDLIFDPDLADEIPALKILTPADAELWLQGVRRYRTTMEACDVFIGSTEQLCHHASLVTGMTTERFGNGVGLLLGQLSDAALAVPRRPGPPRLGYFSGTTTHDRDWAQVEPAVLDAMERHPSLGLWLVGHLEPSSAVHQYQDRIRVIPFLPWQQLPRLLRDVDLNLVPLETDSRFNQSKSAIKWLEAALVATPTVASPTQPYREVIEAGRTGLLASDNDEWSEAIDTLVKDPDLLAGMGAQARRAALLTLSPHLQGARYLDILVRAARHGTRGQTRQSASVWAPVALDEPFQTVVLEPYTLPGSGPGGDRGHAAGVRSRLLASPAATHARRALASWRRDGGAATARRTARLIVRRLAPTIGRQHERPPRPGSPL